MARTLTREEIAKVDAFLKKNEGSRVDTIKMTHGDIEITEKGLIEAPAPAFEELKSAIGMKIIADPGMPEDKCLMIPEGTKLITKPITITVKDAPSKPITPEDIEALSRALSVGAIYVKDARGAMGLETPDKMGEALKIDHEGLEDALKSVRFTRGVFDHGKPVSITMKNISIEKPPKKNLAKWVKELQKIK